MAQSRPETQSFILDLAHTSKENDLAQQAVKYAQDMIKHSGSYNQYLINLGLAIDSDYMRNIRIQISSMRHSALNDEESVMHLFRIPDFTQDNFYTMKKAIKTVKKHFEYEIGNCWENAFLISNFYYNLNMRSDLISFTNGDHIFPRIHSENFTSGFGVDAWWIANPIYPFTEENLSQYKALTHHKQPLYKIKNTIEIDENLKHSYACALNYLDMIRSYILKYPSSGQGNLLALINFEIIEIQKERTILRQLPIGIEKKLYQRIKFILKQSLIYAKNIQNEKAFIISLVNKRMDMLDKLFTKYSYLKENTLFHILSFSSETVTSLFIKKYPDVLNTGLMRQRYFRKDLLQIYAQYRDETHLLLLLKALNERVISDLIEEDNLINNVNILKTLVKRKYPIAFNLILHKMDKKRIESYLSSKKLLLSVVYDNLGPSSILKLFSKLYGNNHKIVLNKAQFHDFLNQYDKFDEITEKELMQFFQKMRSLVIQGFSFSLLISLSDQSITLITELMKSDKENVKSLDDIMKISKHYTTIDYFLRLGFNFDAIIANEYAAVKCIHILKENYNFILSLKSSGWDFSKYTSEDIILFFNNIVKIKELKSEGYFLYSDTNLTHNFSSFFSEISNSHQENRLIIGKIEEESSESMNILSDAGFTKKYLQDFKHSQTLRLVMDSAEMIKETISQLPKHQHQKFRAILLNMTATEFIECRSNNSFASLLKQPPYLQPINPGIHSYKK